MEGVVGFISAKDVQGDNHIGPIIHDEECFLTDIVTSIGQSIGLIVAKSESIAKSATKLVKVEYEKDGNIESTADHDQLLASLLNSDKATVRRKDGDVEAAFKNADKVIRAEFQCPFIPHNPMEPMNFFFRNI